MVREIFAEALLPPPKETISEWADKYRVLPSKGSAEPGRWRTSKTPYLKEIMDVMSPMDETKEVVFMKATQIGGTEVGNNVIFYYMDYYPSPMLQILHTEGIAKNHMKDKLIPSIKAMDRLNKKVTWAKSNQGGTTRTEIQFKGASLKLGWAQTPSTFASMSRRIVICDDIDRWKDDVGSEGNPVALAKRRANAFRNKKIFINSSPTQKGDSLIEEEFNETDQRHYYVPCPQCGEYVRFEKEDFVYEYDEERGELTSDVKFCCPKCGSLIDESQKMGMLQKGKWIPHNPKSSKKGYRLPAFYSPWFTWQEAFGEYVKALKKEKEGKPEFMKTWVNTIEALPYENRLEVTELSIEIDDLLQRREKYPAEVPDGVLVLTAGVDTQDNRFEIEVVGWGEGLESWSIEYAIIPGDPANKETQEALDLFLKKRFAYEGGGEIGIYAVCVDTQGHKTQSMYEFCKKRFLKKIFAIKGSNKQDTPITTGRFSLSNKGKVPLFHIGVNAAKDEIYSALEVDTPGTLYCHFPNRETYDEEYFKQLLAEKRINGVWKKRGRKRNEAIDCRVYARAALAIAGVDVDELAKRDKILKFSKKETKKRRLLSKGIG